MLTRAHRGENDVNAAAASAETWPEYLRRIVGDQSQSLVAQQVGVGRLSVCNWLQGKTRPRAETAILVARVYGRSPIEALLAARYLNHDELDTPMEIKASPKALSSADLAAEVHRRLTAAEV
jgi:transcriptional regulator with XRE-family HTH domain